MLIMGFDQQTVDPVLDDIRSTLPLDTYDGFAVGHSFQVDNPEAFIPAGQHEQITKGHVLHNLTVGLGRDKLNYLVNSQFPGQALQVFSLPPADNQKDNLVELLPYGFKSPQGNVVPLCFLSFPRRG